jgi:hypothetical protein
MAKSLSERIAARSVKKKPSRSAQNRAAFLALRVDIKQALDDGWPVKSIWETLHEEGKIDFSYQAFRGYANRLILSPPATEPPAPPPVAEATPAPGASNPTKPASPKTVVKKPDTAAGFTFNSKPNKEDLL